MDKRLIDANDFDERIRAAGGMVEDDLTEDFKDGVLTVLAMLKTHQTVLTIPENPTNGDMIKALFPNIEIYDSEKMESVYTGIPFGKYIGANVDCMRDWWNAPYKEI